MTPPHPQDSSQSRDEGDEAIDERRRMSDGERAERRGIHDRTRQQSARGQGQTRASLDRERALDDADRQGERRLVDRKRVQERSRSDRDSREQAALLEAAEDQLDTARQDKDDATLERRAALRVTRVELDRLGEALAEIQTRCGSDPQVTAAVDLALACVGRLARSLAQALDPEDMRGAHHDVGGSG